MTFHDLPENLRQTPLDTPALRADAVDLFLDLRDRADDSLLIGFCDEAHRLIAPVVIAGVEWRDEAARRRSFLARLAEAGVSNGAAGVVVGLSSFRLITPPLAELWRREAAAAFGAEGIELLGLCVAGRHRVVEVEASSPSALATAEPVEVVAAAARIAAAAA
ncbi:MAG: hypothetical protein GXX90_04620 [Microbacteriaceae bacterium]|nr:hypothetical protein [Microbacteriaceae bacterium]